MTYKVVSTAPQGSEEWLEVRRNGIGGSDIAAILGKNPWRSRLDVYLDKAGKTDPLESNERMSWGSKLEPVVRDHYAELHPRYWVDEVPGVLGHAEVTAALASVDGIVQAKDGTRLLEIKCTAQSWEQPPDYYLYQGMHYMAVTGIPVLDFAVLTRGNTYTEYEVPAEQSVLDYLLEEVADFWWNHLDPNGPKKIPDPDPVRDRDILPKLWQADVTAEPVVLPTFMVDRLRDTKAALAAAKTDYEVACAEVQVALGEAVAGVDSTGSQVCTWGPVKGRTTVDRKALADDGLLEKYQTTGQPGRVFRVK